MSELKNCPFCGGEAKVLSVGSKDHTDWFKSECKGCEVSTNWYPAKSMLIKQWNTRKPEQVLLEALKGILRQAVFSGLNYIFVLDIIDSAREAIQGEPV